MAGLKPNELYDAYYYAHGCGVPYERNEHWLRSFAAIAERIVADIQPQSALDAGCAMGLLVETLRDRGVDAYGVDISTYAIEQVYAPIKPFCRVGSIADALPQRYDLIVCIEVLEHMEHADAEAAIVNLCRHTDDLLFSSTPFDYKETTHFNVQPPEYWAAQFARQGFYRDVDFDAAFVTPWAVRFRRRRHDPFHQVVQDYERRYWMLSKESGDLRALVQEMRGHNAEAEQAIRTLSLQLLERDRAIQHYAHELKNRALAYKYLQQELQGYIDRLQADLAQKIAHIDELKAAIERLESGRLMRALRLMERRRAQPAAPPAPAPAPALADPYQRWIAAYEPGPDELEAQRRQAGAFALRPLISLITPVYNPPPEVLAATVASVRAQTYPHWELCLVDGGSAHPRLRPLMEEFARDDSRIRVRFLQQNRGIAGNSNAALEMAQGEFALLFDHDDLLAPNALYEVVRLLNAQPETDIVYYDEDKIDAEGLTRHSPWFKPSTWSPDLLLATNLLMHSVIRRDLIVRAGGFDSRTDGAQDWDLALRCSELTSRIRHLPMVLYHWRQVAGSAASHVYAKPWALDAQALCIAAHLRRSEGIQPRVTFPYIGSVQILWPTFGLKVSIIIPTRDDVALLRNCLAAIRNTTRYPNYEIILVDVGGVQPEMQRYYAQLAEDDRIRVVTCAGPSSFAMAANTGARYASGDRLVFLGAATEALTPDWLEELAGWGERATVGVAGAKILYPDGTIKHAGMTPGLAGYQSSLFYGEEEPAYSMFGTSEWYRNCAAVSSECLLLRRELFERLGGFDATYQGDLATLDLCLRAGEQGYRVVYTPFARLLSHGGPPAAPPPADAIRAYMRLLPLLQAGPLFFSPNLSPAHTTPTFALPAAAPAPALLAQQLHAAGLVADPDLAFPFTDTAPPQPPPVALATPDLGRDDASLMLYRLARHLVAQGQPVTLLAAAGGPLEAEYAAAGIPVRIEPHLFADARIAYRCVQGSAAVVVNSLSGGRLVHAARAAAAPCLWWVHEGRAGRALVQTDPVAVAAFAAAATVVFPTETLAALYADLTPGAQVQAIPYGLEEPPPPAAAPELLAAERVVVVAPGEIAPHRGQDTLLRAIALLPEALAQQAQFYLIGDAGDWMFVKEVASVAEQSPHVRLLGALPPDQAAAYLAAADIVALPWRDAGLPPALLEAMARGKAIVAAAVEGIGAAIAHDQEGLLFPTEDYRELARSLALLIGDAAARRRLGDQARGRFHRDFTAARFEQAMARELTRIAQQRPPVA